MMDESDEGPATHGPPPPWGVLKRAAVPGLGCSVHALKSHEADNGYNLEKVGPEKVSSIPRHLERLAHADFSGFSRRYGG